MEEKMMLIEQVAAFLGEKNFVALREALLRYHPQDIADVLTDLPGEAQTVAYRLLPKETAAEVFVAMEASARERLVADFSDREIRETLEELYLDDTVDIIEEMPAGLVRRILKNATAETRREINQLLKYPADSAGSMMTTELVRLRSTLTVAGAFDTIRRVALDKETVYTCYVTDEARRLMGVVSVKTLLLSSPETPLAEIMETPVLFVNTHTNRAETARMFDRYDLLALPVVDGEERLVGIITVDDALDVIHEETEEDFAVLSAVTPTETPYLRTSVPKIFATRIPWLLLLMLLTTATGIIIAAFESKLAACVALTAFIPMLMGTGGNSGSQASVTVIRGLSLGEIAPRDAARVLWKELQVSFLCAVVLGVVAFGKVLLVDGWLMNGTAVTPMVALTVAVTLAVTVLCAKLIGGLLPVAAQKLHLDPAVMAGPFITTLIDTISLLVYFTIASALLGL